MALASGWKREDAVVSQATGRLQQWIASGLWSASDVDEGTRRLAQAMARLLAARAVLLLVRTPDNAWQPVSLAMASPNTPPGKVNVLEFPLEEASPLSLQAASGIFAGVEEPLPRDNWSPSQAAFAASAQAFVRDQSAQAAAAQADSTRALDAHDPDAAAASTSSPSSRGLGTTEMARGGAKDLLDSNNSVADWASADQSESAWQSEPPSLLLLLPCSRAEDEAPAEGACPSACGVALAWIESEDGRLSDEWLPLWSSCAGQAGAWLESALRFERVGRSYRDLANLAARVVDARDATREGHGPLVAYACGLMAQALGLGAREAQEWEMAGLLHGIGRVPIADALLQKEGSLSIEERDTIRDSMQAGAQWLAQVEGWANVARLVRHAGERWDGQGYPDGLGGEAIPLGSRALAIALRFASLAQARPDREALGSLRNVGAALESEAGSALDANLTTLFLGTLRGGTR